MLKAVSVARIPLFCFARKRRTLNTLIFVANEAAAFLLSFAEKAVGLDRTRSELYNNSILVLCEVRSCFFVITNRR